ncbi:calcium-dependent protein kinase 1-like [Haliotis rubra]|uniref:calcium-dependent protein kinase 1-like n=1 Tax=Haliotis rubra TaxID=36100 RepID=UPI001EE5788A|nr:calcium-dependent protein kinase 1-like [Haliotis rubra]XP_046548893.1 calcium-dependent protein kinase 1-like [Haliotis rubra]
MPYTVGDYTFYEELGSGAFGTVLKAKRNGQGRYFAVKRISLRDDNVDRELDSQRALPRCRFVVELVDHFFSSRNMYLVLDYCNSGTLNDYMTEYRVSNRRRLSFMQDMIKGLKHLHHHAIVHRDIKPDNILLHTRRGRRPICKLSDFGLARYNGSETDSYYEKDYYLQTGCGTMYYIAPEVLTRHYTEACDIFSLGVVFYAMYAEEMMKDGETLIATVDDDTPFHQASNKTIRRRVDWAVENRAVADCIKDMVQKDYHKRVDIDELDVNFRMATL